MAWSPKNHLLAIITYYGKLIIYDIGSGKEVLNTKLSASPLITVKWVKDYLIVGDRDGNVYILHWLGNKAELIYVFRAINELDNYKSLYVDPSLKYLICGSHPISESTAYIYLYDISRITGASPSSLRTSSSNVAPVFTLTKTVTKTRYITVTRTLRMIVATVLSIETVILSIIFILIGLAIYVKSRR